MARAASPPRMSSGDSGRWFKRSLRGLFAGKTRLTGNHVSPSKAHVKRAWLPNVQRKNLWSDILQRFISINVTTHALKEIDRVGGELRGWPLQRASSTTEPGVPRRSRQLSEVHCTQQSKVCRGGELAPPARRAPRSRGAPRSLARRRGRRDASENGSGPGCTGRELGAAIAHPGLRARPFLQRPPRALPDRPAGRSHARPPCFSAAPRRCTLRPRSFEHKKALVLRLPVADPRAAEPARAQDRCNLRRPAMVTGGGGAAEHYTAPRGRAAHLFSSTRSKYMTPAGRDRRSGTAGRRRSMTSRPFSPPAHAAAMPLQARKWSGRAPRDVNTAAEVARTCCQLLRLAWARRAD